MKRDGKIAKPIVQELPNTPAATTDSNTATAAATTTTTTTEHLMLGLLLPLQQLIQLLLGGHY